jgi:hypothetical protein
MELQEVVRRMNERVQTIERERSRIADFVQELEQTYLQHDRQESARACRVIVDHLRSI